MDYVDDPAARQQRAIAKAEVFIADLAVVLRVDEQRLRTRILPLVLDTLVDMHQMGEDWVHNDRPTITRNLFHNDS